MTLTGTKRHVAFAASVDRLVVLAREPAGVSLFLVDPAATGVTLSQQLSVASDTQYRVDFDEVRVADAELPGEVDLGQRIRSLGSGLDKGEQDGFREIQLESLEPFVVSAAYATSCRHQCRFHPQPRRCIQFVP